MIQHCVLILETSVQISVNHESWLSFYSNHLKLFNFVHIPKWNQFPFKKLFTGVWLMYNVVLTSAEQQSYSLYIYGYIPFHILFHYDLLPDTEYSFLCYTAGLCCLSILCCYSVVKSCPTLCSTPGLQHTSLPWISQLLSSELAMPSNQLILCHSLLFLPSIFPSIRILPSE